MANVTEWLCVYSVCVCVCVYVCVCLNLISLSNTTPILISATTTETRNRSNPSSSHLDRPSVSSSLLKWLIEGELELRSLEGGDGLDMPLVPIHTDLLRWLHTAPKLSHHYTHTCKSNLP